MQCSKEAVGLIVVLMNSYVLLRSIVGVSRFFSTLKHLVFLRSSCNKKLFFSHKVLSLILYLSKSKTSSAFFFCRTSFGGIYTNFTKNVI